MTDNLKHSTSYYHEAIAHAFEMFKNGYEPVMETPFQPRRLGSAFVVEYKLVREPLDELAEQAQELDMGYDKQLTIQEKWEIDDDLEHEAICEPTGKDPYYVDPLDIEGGEKEVAETESCDKLVYTKEALDELYWTDLQEVGRKFGVKQRDRKKLTKMILEAQEKGSGN